MPPDSRTVLVQEPETIRAERVLIKEMPLAEMGLTVLFVLVGGLWIMFSDDLYARLTGEPIDSPVVHVMKGLNFVLVTGLVLYLVLRRSFRRRRQAEEALRLSQARFEYVALSTTDVIWDWNLETNVVWWSDGVQKLTGCRRQEVPNNAEWWLERIHPDDKPRTSENLRRATESGGRTWSGHYRVRRQDGSYATVLDRRYIIRDGSGKPVRFVGGISDITERRRAEEALENSRRQLRALSARLQSAREEERSRIAREIHDELGQMLTALKINLDWLERRIGERENDPALNPLLERVVESAEMVDSAIQRVQHVATELRPGALDNLGLAAALEHEARRFQKRTGITCDLTVPPEPLALARDASTAMFRIFQEALTNVARHAGATTVRIVLRAELEQVVLEVEDNGQGIPPHAVANAKSLGLLGMRERASVLGGEVAISRVDARGTRITLRLPRDATHTQFWADL